LFNGSLWAGYFRSEFDPQLRAILEVLERRLLPAFAGIEQEAEKVSQDAWDAFMEAPATGDEDPSEFAEAAEEAGASHYLLLDGIRQGMVNLFAAALYHTFEQQVVLFLRKEILHPREQNNSKLFCMAEFQNRLSDRGLDIADLPSWRKVDELRLVANTVKHAEGKSARELHKVRPGLFQHPQFPGSSLSGVSARVFQPLVGEDLYVSIDDVRQYCDAAVQFWREFGEALQRV
jgi:hypothetical protein